MIDFSQRNRLAYILLFMILVIMPATSVFLVVVQRENPARTETITQVAARAAEIMDRLILKIDGVLQQVLERTATGEACEGDRLMALREPAFFHAEVRQAGIFDRHGRVTCTTWGPEPLDTHAIALGLPAASRAAIFRDTGEGVILSAPVQIASIPSVSVIASKRRPDGSGANVLLDPETLNLALSLAAPEGGVAIALLRRVDGQVIATAGGRFLDLDPLAEGTATEVGAQLLRVRLEGEGEREGVALAVAATPRSARLDSRPYSVVVAEIPVGIIDYQTSSALARASIAGAAGLISFLVFVFLWRRRFSVEGEIRAAITRNELFIEYQPIIEMRTGRCVAAEVLIRWQHPRRGRIRPDLFIDVAEKTGLLTPMTDWLIRRVIEDVTDPKQGAFPSIRVTINLAADHFRDKSFLTRTHERLTAARIEPQRIVFELTERSVVAEKDADLWASVEWLRGLGYRFALDDFGTGYCNISHLQRSLIDYIKIDRSFVHRIQPQDRAPLLDSIVMMARSVQVPVVAEGVETDLHHNYLRDMAVDFGQGYRYSKPLDVKWLRVLFGDNGNPLASREPGFGAGRPVLEAAE